eukprot:4144632-Karenia_brevis.AAC.1
MKLFGGDKGKTIDQKNLLRKRKVSFKVEKDYRGRYAAFLLWSKQNSLASGTMDATDRALTWYIEDLFFD